MIRIPVISPVIQTHLSVRGTYFQHIENMFFAYGFHESFICQRPTDRTRVKSTPTMIFRKIIRPVITHTGFYKITVIIIILDLSDPTGPAIFPFTAGVFHRRRRSRVNLINREIIILTNQAHTMSKTACIFVTS